MSGLLRSAAASLHPGYFALVMATGIVSFGVRIHGLDTFSAVLFVLTAVSYGVLVLLTVWRLARFRAAVLADFRNPARSFGFFSFVAGTGVLGARFALDAHRDAAFALLLVSAVSWLWLAYAVPWVSVLSYPSRPVLQSATGNWFIWVVATQSVAVLAAGLEPEVSNGRSALALLAVLCWSVGIFLYAAVGVLVAARLLLYPVTPEDLTPPYWVAMGATAITVLAGARVVELATAPVVTAVHGLVAGASVAFWAFGTWLFPALLAAGWWRHAVHRVPLLYEPPLWSIVFPLGMYGVAAHYLGAADNVPFIRQIGDAEIWVALVAWAGTFVAMLMHFSSVNSRLARPN